MNEAQAERIVAALERIANAAERTEHHVIQIKNHAARVVTLIEMRWL